MQQAAAQLYPNYPVTNLSDGDLAALECQASFAACADFSKSGARVQISWKARPVLPMFTKIRSG